MVAPSMGVSRHTGVEILFLLQGILLTQGPCKIRTNIETIKNIKHALILVSKHFFTPKRAQFLGGGGEADSRDLAKKIKMNLEHYGKLLKKYRKKKKKLTEKCQKDIVVSLKLLPLDKFGEICTSK